MATSIELYYQHPRSLEKTVRIPIIVVYDRYGLWVHNEHNPSLTLKEVDIIFADLYDNFTRNPYVSVSELKSFLIRYGFEDDSDALHLLDPPVWSSSVCTFLNVDIVDQ